MAVLGKYQAAARINTFRRQQMAILRACDGGGQSEGRQVTMSRSVDPMRCFRSIQMFPVSQRASLVMKLRDGRSRAMAVFLLLFRVSFSISE